jgi:hypothetical protein
MDQFHFVHQPLSGNGSITARVRTQQNSHEWAQAGLIIKETTESGSPYAAVMVTPRHGVHLQSNFVTDIAGRTGTAPRWLKLERSGTSITGYESADGTTWSQVGTVELSTLPRTVHIGFYVTSPYERTIERGDGWEGIGEQSTIGTASFDQVSVESARPAQWSNGNVGDPPDAGGTTENAGVFTVTGSGGIGTYDMGDDHVQMSVSGALLGLLAIIPLGVLFITSEYKDGMIGTTFLVNPRRRRVLAAKAVVIGTTTFVTGLAASVAAFHLAHPRLRANGFVPPGAPPLSLADGHVVRAVVGAAALLAVFAVLSLCVGVILRRGRVAITAVVALLLVPQIVANAQPLRVAAWLIRLTPAAGFATLETLRRYDTAIGPLAAFGVLCAYATVALMVALWLVQRRDA